MSLHFPSDMDLASPELRESVQESRVVIGSLLEHAEYLRIADRDLIRGLYLSGMSASAFARALGRKPRLVRQRALRLVRRIASPQFQFVVRTLHEWAPERQIIARAVILQRLPQRRAAELAEVSLHRVRMELERIRALGEAAPTDSPPSPVKLKRVARALRRV